MARKYKANIKLKHLSEIHLCIKYIQHKLKDYNYTCCFVCVWIQIEGSSEQRAWVQYLDLRRRK